MTILCQSLLYLQLVYSIVSMVIFVYMIDPEYSCVCLNKSVPSATRPEGADLFWAALMLLINGL